MSSNSLITSTIPCTVDGPKVYWSLPSPKSFAAFEIKTKENTVAWITDLTFKINSGDSNNPRSLLDSSSIFLAGPNGATGGIENGEWLSDDTITFHMTMDTRLSKNWGQFTLNLQPISTITTPVTISATLIGTEIKAEDNSGNSLDVSNISNVTSNNITFAINENN